MPTDRDDRGGGEHSWEGSPVDRERFDEGIEEGDGFTTRILDTLESVIEE